MNLNTRIYPLQHQLRHLAEQRLPSPGRTWATTRFSLMPTLASNGPRAFQRPLATMVKLPAIITVLTQLVALSVSGSNGTSAAGQAGVPYSVFRIRTILCIQNCA